MDLPVLLLAQVAASGDLAFWIQISIVGLAVGCIYALAGLGLVLTYKATGIFNFAHGAVGVLVAYTVFQMTTEWGIPVVVAAPFAVLIIGPALGMALERFVFRPLQRRGATTTEKLVATLGVFVLMLGIVITVWGQTSRPGLYGTVEGFMVGDVRIAYYHLSFMAVLAVVAGGLYYLFQRTHLGTEIRAVVDKPELAELASIDANRISSLSWAMGSGLAGLSGVMFASEQLDPFRLTLFMIETFSIPVLARLTNLPLAVGSGVLFLGLGQALFKQVDLFGGTGVLGETFQSLKPNFSTVVLLAFVLIYRRLDTVGEAAERQSTLLRATGEVRTRARAVGAVTAIALVLLPVTLSDYDSAHRFLAMIVIFASIVAVTGFSGQITLGQAGFAGIGAFAAARGVVNIGMPVLSAMLFGGLAAMAAGVLVGWPALRRRGLFLAITTLAFGLFIFYFVLANSSIAGDTTGLEVRRPSLLWWDFHGPLAFYYFELAVVGLALLLTRNLRSGRLGRALAAMRDSENGATSVGIDLRRYKVFIFAVSAFMAGIGGQLLTQQARTFNAIQFFPLESLFWFAVVVVAGIGSITGAVVAAFVFVMLDSFVDVAGLSQLVIGALALLLGRLPGGSLVGMGRTFLDRAVAGGRARIAAERAAAQRGEEPPPVFEPTALAREWLGDGPPPVASPSRTGAPS